MEFRHKILSNGLVILGEVNSFAQSVAVGFFVKTGARDENAAINGVSHFLEHMLFKGTEKLSTFQVNEAFDRTGAKFNAFTSEENTIYFAGVLPEYLAEVTHLWAQLMRPALRDNDFDIEKNVIKEEIAMYKDLPQFDVMDRCKALHFKNHPCGNSVLGSEQSITELTAAQMRDYFNTRYAPNNMLIACAGNFDWEQICSIAEEQCGAWQPHQTPRKLEFYPGSKEKQRNEKANLVREHICLMSPCVSTQDSRRYAAALLAVIVGDAVGSRFYWELVDKAIAETAVMQYEPMDGVGLLCSYFRCSPENADKVISIVGDILNTVGRDGVYDTELQKARNKVLSALTIKNELPMGRLIDLGFNWIYLQTYHSIEKEINLVKAVSIDGIRSVVNEFNLGDFTQFSLGPPVSGQNT